MEKQYKVTLIIEDIETGDRVNLLTDHLVKDLKYTVNTPHKPFYHTGQWAPQKMVPDGDASIKLYAKWEQFDESEKDRYKPKPLSVRNSFALFLADFKARMKR